VNRTKGEKGNFRWAIPSGTREQKAAIKDIDNKMEKNPNGKERGTNNPLDFKRHDKEKREDQVTQ